MAKNYFIITDSDLDGICSFITLSWFLTGEPNIPHKFTTVGDFKQDIGEWLKLNKLSEYDKVFILDLDISDHIDMIDKKNVVVIDHHRTHVPNIEKYKKAKAIVKEFTSATKLIYEQFKPLKELTKEQKLLVALADDYDCYALKVPTSYDLHVVYYQTQNSVDKTKQEKFIESFGQGFKGFNEFQKNIVKLRRKEVKEILDKLEVFGGKMFIYGKDVIVRSTVCEKAINEVADHLLRDLGADMAIVVNPRSAHVSVRRRATSVDIDVSKFAEDYIEGGGHEYAAGGKVTEKFMNFTTLLRPIEK